MLQKYGIVQSMFGSGKRFLGYFVGDTRMIAINVRQWKKVFGLFHINDSAMLLVLTTMQSYFVQF